MTGTGDFRRFTYSNDVTGAISAFSVEHTSAAPKRRRQSGTEDESTLKLRNGAVKTLARHKEEQRLSTKKALKIAGSAVLVFAMLLSVVYSFVIKNELTKEISSIQSDIAVAQSENTRLNSKLDSLVSMKMIDEYAVEKLGMTKIQKSQINYVDVSAFKAQREKQIENKSPDDFAKSLR